MNEDIENVVAEVKLTIREDILGAELKIAIFSAALLSYRRDSCLRPLPEELLVGSTTDDKIEHLNKILKYDLLERSIIVRERIFTEIPPLEQLLSDKIIISDECWRLLLWLFQSEKSFHANLCDKGKLKEIEKATCKSSFDITPDYLFQITYNTKTSQKFDEQKKQYGIKYGYHGSRADNFYSIVSNGLQVHMVKNGLFGEGVYLSEDLSVTMPYVKGGKVWKHSKLGEQVSCVAVCEILDHPGVKCQTDETDEQSKRRRSADNSELGEVPHKYFVVTNSELVRIKYILLFADQKASKIEHRPSRSLIREYPVATILILYVILLCFMSLWRSDVFKIYWRKYIERDRDDDF